MKYDIKNINKQFFYQELLIEKIPKGYIKNGLGKAWYNKENIYCCPKNFYSCLITDNGYRNYCNKNGKWESTKKRPYWIVEDEYYFSDINIECFIKTKKGKIYIYRKRANKKNK